MYFKSTTNSLYKLIVNNTYNLSDAYHMPATVTINYLHTDKGTVRQKLEYLGHSK